MQYRWLRRIMRVWFVRRSPGRTGGLGRPGPWQKNRPAHWRAPCQANARRGILPGLLAFFILLAAAPSFGVERLEINFDYVSGRASQLAEKPYDDNWGQIPEDLKNLAYDAYQDIRFEPARALWTEEALPFRIEFMHPGGLFNRTVRINEFTESHVQEIPFNPNFFNYGKHDQLRASIPSSLGYAGFRVLYPLNKTDVYDAFAVFVGASYFRIVGRGQTFGLSARGLALNTSVGPEEFPTFREYWLGKPKPKADKLEIYSLLDGPSVAGAYQFTLHPGKETVVDVRATLYFRQEVKEVGLAPFSSMFLHGENSLSHPPDYRPEVHDSDGLLIAMPEGRQLWQPLDNPTSGTQISRRPFKAPAMFGLMQRDRNFEDYQDIGAAYQLRPSALVTSSTWGPGQVALFEFGARSEAVDNIVAYWTPDQGPTVGKPYSYQYTLNFSSNEPTSGGLAIATRTGRDVNRPDLYECVVDFAGTELSRLAEVDAIKPVLEENMGGKVEEVILHKNPFNGTWRLFIKFHPPAPGGPRELRAHLEFNGKPISETWIYRWMNLPN